jgi:hypothetical protein
VTSRTIRGYSQIVFIRVPGRGRAVEPAKMMKGDNLTEQFPRRTQSDDGRQVAHQGLFRAAGQEAEERDPAARSIAPSAAAQPSWDVFSHASEYDVAEQQRPATQHDEVAMRSFQLPFLAEAMSPMQSISGGRCPSMRTTTDKLHADSWETLPIRHASIYPSWSPYRGWTAIYGSGLGSFAGSSCRSSGRGERPTGWDRQRSEPGECGSELVGPGPVAL